MTELTERAIIWEMVKGIGWPVWAFCTCVVVSAFSKAHVHDDWTIVILPTLAVIAILGQAVSISGADMLISEYKRLLKYTRPIR